MIQSQAKKSCSEEASSCSYWDKLFRFWAALCCALGYRFMRWILQGERIFLALSMRYPASRCCCRQLAGPLPIASTAVI